MFISIHSFMVRVSSVVSEAKSATSVVNDLSKAIHSEPFNPTNPSVYFLARARSSLDSAGRVFEAISPVLSGSKMLGGDCNLKTISLFAVNALQCINALDSAEWIKMSRILGKLPFTAAIILPLGVFCALSIKDHFPIRARINREVDRSKAKKAAWLKATTHEELAAALSEINHNSTKIQAKIDRLNLNPKFIIDPLTRSLKILKHHNKIYNAPTEFNKISWSIAYFVAKFSVCLFSCMLDLNAKSYFPKIDSVATTVGRLALVIIAAKYTHSFYSDIKLEDHRPIKTNKYAALPTLSS